MATKAFFDLAPAKRQRPDEPAASQFSDDPRLEREHANAKSVIRGVAQEFVCPIDQTPVYDAVLAADGCVYERRAIEEWFDCASSKNPDTGLFRSPSTGAPLANRTLVAAPSIKNAAQRLVESGTLDIEMVEAWEQKRKEHHRFERQRELARNGDMSSMYAMGVHHYAIGCDKKYSTEARRTAMTLSVSWFKKGAEAKGVKSMACYGRALATGRGVAKNTTKGLYLLMRAAYCGSDLACYLLGMSAAGEGPYPTDLYALLHEEDLHDARVFLEMLFRLHEEVEPGREHPVPSRHRHLNPDLLETAKRTLDKLPPFKPAPRSEASTA